MRFLMRPNWLSTTPAQKKPRIGLALTTRKAGTTSTVTPRKVSVSKPRSLITCTAPLARSMSIPARGAPKERERLLLPFRDATSRVGGGGAGAGLAAEDARRPRARQGADTAAGRRTVCRASAAAEAAAAMAPRRAGVPERARAREEERRRAGERSTGRGRRPRA